MFADSGARQKTNVSSIYFCVGFVVVLLAFAGYCFAAGSIFRLTRGVDDCGNICGKNNKDNGLSSCGSHDKRDLPFTKVDETKDPKNPNVTITHSTCVKSCSDFKDYIEIANRCFKVEKNSTAGNSSNTEPDVDVEVSFFTGVVEDFSVTWPSILITCGVAVVFSYIVLILFRYAIKYVVWIIYLSLVALFVVGCIFMIVLYVAASSSKDPREKEAAIGFLVAAVILGVLAILLGLVLYFFRKRIRLVIQLFKEASKVMLDVPMIMFEPLLTFVFLGFSCLAFLYFALVIESSGDLKIENIDGKFDKASYQSGLLQLIAHYVNVIAFVWFSSFVLGCQHFVIASTTCQWFFTRTKDKLDSPLQRAFSHLLNFHIGSVCLGSMLITLMKIIRAIVDGINKNLRESQNAAAKLVACCCDCIMEMLEEFLKYLVRNAYIIVALNGTPLIESGKKAFRLITKNLIDVIALNKFGDFVLFVGRVFVIAVSGFVCYELVSRTAHVNYPFIPVFISVIIAGLIIHCIMTVFEMTVDTIFVCFCEDCEVNDGMTQPFFMSRGLMEIMMELKGVAGGNFDFKGQNPGGEAGQPLTVPIGWKFGNEQH